jgi:hypothetical protein
VDERHRLTRATMLLDAGASLAWIPTEEELPNKTSRTH